MSEQRAVYSDKKICIPMCDLKAFRDCPRCAYFHYHPNIKVKRPFVKDSPTQQFTVFSRPVEVYDDKENGNVAYEYRVELWYCVNDEITKEVMEDLDYAVNVLNQRDFPLQSDSCELCKYYDLLFDAIA